MSKDSGESLAVSGWASSFSWYCLSPSFAIGRGVICFQYKSFVFIRGCVHLDPDEVPPSSASKVLKWSWCFSISTGGAKKREGLNTSRRKCVLILQGLMLLWQSGGLPSGVINVIYGQRSVCGTQTLEEDISRKVIFPFMRL